MLWLDAVTDEMLSSSSLEEGENAFYFHEGWCSTLRWSCFILFLFLKYNYMNWTAKSNNCLSEK